MGHAARSVILKPLHVDFACPPRWPAAMLWMLVLAVLAGAGWVGARDLRAWQELSTCRERTAALQSQLDTARAVVAARAASAAEPPPFAVDARRWMALASVDGAGVLRTVESAQVGGAKMINIDVNVEARQAELEVEVTSAQVAATYLQALNAGLDQPAWELVRLQTQSTSESALIRGQIQ